MNNRHETEYVNLLARSCLIIQYNIFSIENGWYVISLRYSRTLYVWKGFFYSIGYTITNSQLSKSVRYLGDWIE